MKKRFDWKAREEALNRLLAQLVIGGDPDDDEDEDDDDEGDEPKGPPSNN